MIALILNVQRGRQTIRLHRQYIPRAQLLRPGLGQGHLLKLNEDHLCRRKWESERTGQIRDLD